MKMTFEAFVNRLDGNAAGMTEDDIAKKHSVSVEDIKKQLIMGISVEHEHTKDEATAKKIALDHLWEFPEYYTALKQMEGKLKKDE